MKTTEKIDLNQPKNKLTDIADTIRKQQITRNDYKFGANEYSQTNKDAISDGDGLGRGTGVFLDTANGGTIIDQIERKEEIKINSYQPQKPYTFPTV
jgi:hypothetical protein